MPPAAILSAGQNAVCSLLLVMGQRADISSTHAVLAVSLLATASATATAAVSTSLRPAAAGEGEGRLRAQVLGGTGQQGIAGTRGL